MTTREQGVAAIKAHEGLRLQAYPDPASGGEPWTIGYGHTGGVKPGDVITLEQAEQFLADDIATAQMGIRALVSVPLNSGQLWALTSFVFNLGAGALKKSTLLTKLNAGDYKGAADEFGKWINAAGKPMAGLVTRRTAERAMFLRDGAPQQATPAPKPPPFADTGEPPSPFDSPQPKPVKEPTMPIPAILAALLPSLIESIPKLGKLFGSGSDVAERNVAAATMAMRIAQEAVGAKSDQEAVETIAADPVVAAKVREAIESRWLDLTEAGGDGIAGARKADAEAMTSAGPWWQVVRSPSFVIACLLLPLVYLIVGNVAGLYGAEWSPDARAGIAGSIAGGIVMGLIGYYYGQTTSRNRTPPP